MKKNFQIHIKNIIWDADDIDDIKDLSTDLILPNSKEYYKGENINTLNDDDFISDKISDEIGFTHKGFEYNIVYQK